MNFVVSITVPTIKDQTKTQIFYFKTEEAAKNYIERVRSKNRTRKVRYDIILEKVYVQRDIIFEYHN